MISQTGPGGLASKVHVVRGQVAGRSIQRQQEVESLYGPVG